jgi:hypothetical protein
MIADELAKAQEVVASATPTVEGPSMADYAAREYQALMPKFRKEVGFISGKQAKEVLIAMMEYPLEKTHFTWSAIEASKVFDIGAEIMDCRFVLMKALIVLTVEQKRAILDDTVNDPVYAAPVEQGEQNAPL